MWFWNSSRLPSFPSLISTFPTHRETPRRKREAVKKRRKSQWVSFTFLSYNAQIRSQFDVIQLGCKNLYLVRLNWVKMHQVYIKIHNYGNLTALWMSFKAKNVPCLMWIAVCSQEKSKKKRKKKHKKHGRKKKKKAASQSDSELD